MTSAQPSIENIRFSRMFNTRMRKQKLLHPGRDKPVRPAGFVRIVSARSIYPYPYPIAGCLVLLASIHAISDARASYQLATARHPRASQRASFR